MKRNDGKFTYVRLSKGFLSSNTYIFWDETKECAIVDPGNTLDSIQKVVNDNGLVVKYIILTHAHYDHIYYMDDVRNAFSEAHMICHEFDKDYFAKPHKNGSLLFGSAKIFCTPDRTVKDNEKLPLGNEEITIIHTPGHTEGGMCILADKYLFTGDTLFYEGYGRTDLVGGSVEEMADSLDRLFALDQSTIVLPGHGTFSTIGHEMHNNPFMGV